MAAAMNSGATVNGAGVSNASSGSATAMDDGKIDGIGTHDELVKNNKIYREVYDSQMKGSDIDG